MCKACRIDFVSPDEIEEPVDYRLALTLARYADGDDNAWLAIRSLEEISKQPRSAVPAE
jgi:hypothetical protein